MVDFCLRIVTFAYPWRPAPSCSWRVVLVANHRLFVLMVVAIGDVLNLILVHRILLGYAVVDVLVFRGALGKPETNSVQQLSSCRLLEGANHGLRGGWCPPSL